MIDIRDERSEDIDSVAEVVRLAFPREPELIELLAMVRADGAATVSLVATVEERVLGYILLSPVSLGGASQLSGLGLGPLGVHPDFQNGGIGMKLSQMAIERSRELGADYVVVLGHKNYYPRFGFTSAAEKNLRFSDEDHGAFMVLELTPDCLAGVSGQVRYHRAFYE